jgi:hypothetical protein
VLGAITCIIGVSAIRTGHRKYYRKAVYKKTLAEDVLGLGSRFDNYPYRDANLSLATTEGQIERHEILHDTERWLGRPLKETSVVSLAITMLCVLAIIDGCGAWFAIDRWLHPPTLLDDLLVTLRTDLL